MRVKDIRSRTASLMTAHKKLMSSKGSPPENPTRLILSFVQARRNLKAVFMERDSDRLLISQCMQLRLHRIVGQKMISSGRNIFAFTLERQPQLKTQYKRVIDITCAARLYYVLYVRLDIKPFCYVYSMREFQGYFILLRA